MKYLSDNIQLVRAINSKFFPMELFGVLKDIESLSLSFDFIFFSHIQRNCNVRADLLARLALFPIWTLYETLSLNEVLCCLKKKEIFILNTYLAQRTFLLCAFEKLWSGLMYPMSQSRVGQFLFMACIFFYIFSKSPMRAGIVKFHHFTALY